MLQRGKKNDRGGVGTLRGQRTEDRGQRTEDKLLSFIFIYTLDMEPPLVFGPWICISPALFSLNGTHIYTTTDSDWVVKVNEASANTNKDLDELSNILRLNRRKDHHPHSIELPETLFDMYGRTSTHGWYAMRRYNGNASIQPCVWNRLARQVLEFLRVLHQTHNLVHMDIKLENILVDGAGETGNYVVADYDLMTVPSKHPLLCELEEDGVQWYYAMMGARMDESVYSYRMDLTALGYAVARQSWPSDVVRPLFRSICISNRIRRRRQMSVDSIETVLRERDIEMENAHPAICAYFKRLDELVEWSGPPPSDSVYAALADVFP